MTGRSSTPVIAIGFASVIAFSLILVMLGLSRMSQISASLERVVKEYNVHGKLATEMRRASRERSMLLHAMAVTEDPFERDEMFLKLRELGGDFLAARDRLMTMDLSPNEREMLELQRTLSAEAGPLQYQVIDYLAQDRVEEANRVLLKEAIPAQERALRLIDSFVALQQEHNREALEVTSESFANAYRTMVALGVVIVLVSIAVALVVMRRVGGMMTALEHSNGRLAHLNAELQRARDGLERRVAERTEELRATNDQLRDEIVEREKAEERLTYLANYDAVTGLPNRTLFTEHLKLTLAQARRRQARVALLFMDLDGFKQVNDDLGHEAGDRLLREVAERLRGGVRGEDMAARIGGDEFTLILNGVNDTRDAAVVAEKVVTAFREPFVIGGHIRHIGVSIGIALYPDDTADMDTLLRHADDAMYAVKRGGKNDYRYHGGAVAQVSN